MKGSLPKAAGVSPRPPEPGCDALELANKLDHPDFSIDAEEKVEMIRHEAVRKHSYTVLY